MYINNRSSAKESSSAMPTWVRFFLAVISIKYLWTLLYVTDEQFKLKIVSVAARHPCQRIYDM